MSDVAVHPTGNTTAHTSAHATARALELTTLQQALAGQSLSPAQSEDFFQAVAEGTIDPIVLSSVLTALKLRGETAAEITGAAKAFRGQATPFPALSRPTIDCCGTGGDGSNTINISTTAAIVAASMGLCVAKHGNRSVSSQSGSADLFEQLGVNIQLTPTQAAECLEACGLAFLFAPTYHAGIRHAMPVRQALKTRTLFNVLGPLLNPTAPRFQLLGVYDQRLLPLMAQSLANLGVCRAMVVHGVTASGQACDEIVLDGITHVCEVQDGVLSQYTLTAADFGLAPVSLADLAGGDAKTNALATQAILKGQGPAAHNAAIAVNVAAMLKIAGDNASLADLTARVLAHLATGAAFDTLAQLIALSQPQREE